MTTNRKRLQLNRETLTALADDEIADVAGGALPLPSIPSTGLTTSITIMSRRVTCAISARPRVPSLVSRPFPPVFSRLTRR